MNFCGTLGRYDGKFLTFALHCQVLIDPLIELHESRNDKPNRKPRKPWLGVSSAEESGQIKMFPIPMDKCEEYAKFARTLVWFLPENQNRNASWEEFFEKRKGLEFDDYEFYGFFNEFYNGQDMAVVKSMISQLEAVSRGERLSDYMLLIDFLGKLESHGLWEHQNQRGGCF